MVNYEIIKKRANDLLFQGNTSKLVQYKEAYAWYTDNQEEIKKQIQQSLHKSIVKQASKIHNKIKRYPYVNKIPKTLFRLCNLYKDSPERIIRVDGEIDDELTEMYNAKVAECGLDMLMNKNHRLAMFFNTIIVGPYFDEDGLQLRTYLPFEYIVIPKANDKSRMDALLLLNKKEVEPGVFENSVVVWTKEKHYVITSDLNSKVVNTNTEKKNPYGIIPFVVLRMQQDDYDFQGQGFGGMIEACLSASVNLTYSNFLIPYNIGGVLVAKNTGFDKARSEQVGDKVNINNQIVDINETPDSNLEIAPDSVLSLKDSYQGKDASLSFLSLQSDLSVVRNEVDWLTKNSLSDAGVDLNSIVLERGYTSGFGIVAESVGLMEIRKEHIPILAKFEKDLFNMIKLLLNHEEDIEEYYPDEAELSIDYTEPTFPRTIEEIQKEREMKLKQNTISYLDLIKEDNIDITNDTMARQKLMENYKINKEVESIFGISGSSVFNAQNEDEENANTGTKEDVIAGPDPQSH